MTEFLDAPGGRIACDVTGSGPLVVLSHGIGDHRQAFRFLAPMLTQAGYRVANADPRGHGESSMGGGPTTDCVALPRQLVTDETLGCSARSILALWRRP